MFSDAIGNVSDGIVSLSSFTIGHFCSLICANALVLCGFLADQICGNFCKCQSWFLTSFQPLHHKAVLPPVFDQLLLAPVFVITVNHAIVSSLSKSN